MIILIYPARSGRLYISIDRYNKIDITVVDDYNKTALLTMPDQKEGYGWNLVLLYQTGLVRSKYSFP